MIGIVLKKGLFYSIVLTQEADYVKIKNSSRTFVGAEIVIREQDKVEFPKSMISFFVLCSKIHKVRSLF